jgi:EAL domain-containing protein (putative c-di-GMP-specific phosphodiesterase class I)/DNA-binding response OmpR family regulator
MTEFMMDPVPSGPILVVDDDAHMRGTLTAVLNQAGLETREAGNGREALQRVASEPMGAVVLDRDMPVMGGLATLRILRSQHATSTLPVVLINDPGEKVPTLAGLEAGANDELTKPVDPGELVARLRAHLRAQAAWSQVVGAQRQERDAVAQLLRDAANAPTPETTAQAICTELAALRQTASCAVLAFAGQDQAVTLAAAGRPVSVLRPGARVPGTVARRLHELASQGPWLEPKTGGSNRLLHSLLSEDLPAAAYAPIRGRDLQGVLVLTPDEQSVLEDPSRAGSRCLSTAIDFAAVADALLAPALARRGEVALQRSALLHALDARTFSPVFQPIVDLRDGHTVGYELLTRFDDGAAPEGRFAEAEAVGMGIALELATMAIGVAAAVTLPEGAFLSLNVSPSFLLKRTGVAVAELARACDRRIVLEITEHDPIDDYAAVLAAVGDLGVDVQLSVDDAGAGYASLRHILALRPAFVKLDQGWITGIDSDPARQALVAGLCHFASRTGCRLIGEGIEREQELEMLRELGVTLGQGYLLGRPAAPIRVPS